MAKTDGEKGRVEEGDGLALQVCSSISVSDLPRVRRR